jgi:hypothetical protein
MAAPPDKIGRVGLELSASNLPDQRLSAFNVGAKRNF